MDWRCPIEDGLYIPDCGGLCKWMEMCTGVKPLFLGKPAPEMIYQVEEIFKVKPEEVILVGDRHYTDIMAGINAGIDTLAVLTGETTREAKHWYSMNYLALFPSPSRCRHRCFHRADRR